MKNIYCMLAVLFLGTAVYAQRPGGQGGEGREMPEIGHVVGKVLDAGNGEPVEYATVALMRVKDSVLVTGGTTDAKGRFDISGIKLGMYLIKINFIGYNEYVHGPVKLFPQGDGIELDLGVVQLQSAITEMEEVEVVAERDIVEMGIDKKIFSVAKNIAAEGGAATDVLKNIPSINVDIDGNISLRGSENVTVLIDGRPSGLSGASRQAILEQIPAATIERIEVITNPSSRYDADGMAGIINIITKKNALQGMNGSVTASIGTNNKYNGSANLNYRVKKWNFYTNYNFRYEDRFMYGTSYRETFLSADTASRIDQDDDGGMVMQSHVGKIGVDFSPNSKNTISFGILANGNVRDRDELNNYRILGANLLPAELRERDTYSYSDGLGIDLNLDYVRTFEKPQKELMIGARQSFNRGDGNSWFEEMQYWANNDPITLAPIQQRNFTNSYNSVTTLQLDFINPINKVSRYEAGYKSIIRDIDDDFYSESYNAETESFTADVALNNRFRYQEQVHSLYGIYGRNMGKWSTQVGLRVEQTFVDATLVTTGETFENDYLSAFPNAYLNYMPNESHEFRVSYSRRIDRPNTRQINPFVDVSDPLNIRKGNPFLFPEFVDSYELSYTRSWKKTTLASSVYWRERHDVISRFNQVDENGISTFTFINLLTGRSYGVEVVGNFKPYKWWDLNLSGNLFRNVIDGSNVDATLTNEATSYTLKAISTWELPKDLQIQLSSNYRSPFVSAQGNIRSFYSTDIAFSKKVLEGRGTLNLRVSDIFNTLQFRIEFDEENFTQLRSRKRETRIAYLTFSYRFGKADRGMRKQRRDRERGEGGGGGDFDMD